MVADIEELEEMDASELHARRLNAKEVLTPTKVDNFIFPVADGTVKTPGGNRRLTPSTFVRDRPERVEEQEVFRGESFSPSGGTQSQTVHAERRIIFLKYIDVTRNTHTSLYVLLEKILTITWTPPDGYTWSGERLTRKQTTSRPNDVWPDMWKYMSDAAKKKAKQRWVIEKPKLENARQLKGIFLIEPNDEEFKLTMRAAGRKLEGPMPAAMPCKTPVNCRGETCSSTEKRKTKDAYIIEADESMRIRMEGSQSKNHEDHIAGKGMNSLCQYNLVHKFIPMRQAMKTPDAKPAVEK